MRDNITLEQFKGLTQDQKENFRNLWTPQFGDLYVQETWWRKEVKKTLVFRLHTATEEVGCNGGDECPGIPDLKAEDKDKAHYEKKANLKAQGYYYRSYPLLSIGQMLEYISTCKDRNMNLYFRAVDKVWEVLHNGKSLHVGACVDCCWAEIKNILSGIDKEE